MTFKADLKHSSHSPGGSHSRERQIKGWMGGDGAICCIYDILDLILDLILPFNFIMLFPLYLNL